jgi:hypothetical protein
MSIFNNILEKLGIHKPVAPPVTGKPAATVMPPKSGMPIGGAKPTPIAPVGHPQSTTSAPRGPIGPMAPKPVEMPMVDVVSKLDQLAKSNPLLEWKVSIVDMMKLLGMDSSFTARKELAVELGCPESEMGDSARMNMWLHKTLLKKIAENGGNIPKALLD